jgi:serine/threonine-protein kinase
MQSQHHLLPWLKLALVFTSWIMSAQATNVTIVGLYASGTDDVPSTAYKIAAALAVEAVNANATVLKHTYLMLSVVDHSVLRAVSAADPSYSAQRDAFAAYIVDNIIDLGAVGVVGAGYSSDVEVLAPLLYRAGLPLLSHSATASRLSNTTKFPGFARVCPPSWLEATAMADTIHSFGWSRVGLLYCDDIYCAGLAQDFRDALEKVGLHVDFELRVPTYTSPDRVQVYVKFIHDKILSACAAANDGSGQVAVVTALFLHNPEIVLASSADLPTAWIGDTSIGVKFGFHGPATRSSGIFALRPTETSSNARRESLLKILPVNGNDGYVRAAYDAVWALALAMDAVEVSGEVMDNANILAQLREVRFRGATGFVAFDNHLDPVGSTSQYDVVQFNNDTQATDVVGEWSLDAGVTAFSSPKRGSWAFPVHLCADNTVVDTNAAVTTFSEALIAVVVAAAIVVCALFVRWCYRRKGAEIQNSLANIHCEYNIHYEYNIPDDDKSLSADTRMLEQLQQNPIWACNLARQLINGLKCLHQNRIMHCDLKPSNLKVTGMANAYLQLVICGFHGATRADSDGDDDDAMQIVAKESDIFSAGLLLFYIMTGGDHAFSGTQQELLSTEEWNNTDNDSRASLLSSFRADLCGHTTVSPLAAALIANMLHPDPSERPSIDEIKRDAYFSLLDSAELSATCSWTPICSGDLASVYKASYQQREVACKCIHNLASEYNTSARGDGKDDFCREVQILKQTVNLSNIVEFVGWCKHPEEGLCIVTNFYPTSLNKWLGEATSKSWALAVADGIAIGMTALHSHTQGPIIHADLKPANVLLTHQQPPQVRICDFGVARTKKITTGHIGTPQYMPPEVLNGDEKPSQSTDIYSFGVLLYELFTRKQAFADVVTVEIVGNAREIMDAFYQRGGSLAADFDLLPATVQDLVRECAHKDPNKRPKSFAEVQKLLKDIKSAIEPETPPEQPGSVGPLGQSGSNRRLRRRDMSTELAEEMAEEIHPLCHTTVQYTCVGPNM